MAENKTSWWSKFTSLISIGGKSKRNKGEYAQTGSYAKTKGRFLKGTNIDITIDTIRRRNESMWNESNAK